MAERIYPVSVKPTSGITNWGQWPDDVEPTLRKWNGSGGHNHIFRSRLSFSWFSDVFKCPDCQEFCRQHKPAQLDGDLICDDCLIDRARAEPDQPTEGEQP